MGMNYLSVIGENTETHHLSGVFQFFFVLSQIRLGDINKKSENFQ